MSDFLCLPKGVIQNKRLPKKILFNQSNFNKNDTKLFDCVESIYIHAVLAIDSIGIRGYKDDEVDYERIIVIDVNIKNNNKVSILTEKIHGLFANPIILTINFDNTRYISTAYKRLNLNDKTQTIITEVNMIEMSSNIDYSNYKKALAYHKQQNDNLLNFYRSFTNDLSLGYVYDLLECFELEIFYSESINDIMQKYKENLKIIEELNIKKLTMMRDQMQNHMNIKSLESENDELRKQLAEVVYG